MVGVYAIPVDGWLWEKRLVKNKFLLFTSQVFVIATIAMSRGLVEWVAACLDPAAGAAHLGRQGDLGRANMLADTLGAQAPEIEAWYLILQ
jgi:uncharacterized membrane protein YjdF